MGIIENLEHQAEEKVLHDAKKFVPEIEGIEHAVKAISAFLKHISPVGVSSILHGLNNMLPAQEKLSEAQIADLVKEEAAVAPALDAAEAGAEKLEQQVEGAR